MKYFFENNEEGLDQKKFKVTVEFIIAIDDIDCAEAIITDIIQEGILSLTNMETNTDLIENFDLVETKIYK